LNRQRHGLHSQCCLFICLFVCLSVCVSVIKISSNNCGRIRSDIEHEREVRREGQILEPLVYIYTFDLRLPNPERKCEDTGSTTCLTPHTGDRRVVVVVDMCSDRCPSSLEDVKLYSLTHILVLFMNLRSAKDISKLIFSSKLVQLRCHRSAFVDSIDVD